MQKKLIAAAVMVASGAAMAQSSVTLFGIADATVKLGRGTAANVNAIGSGGNATSRLGFRGVEDLGGGMSAGFHLEAGYTVDSGLGQAGNTNNQLGGAVAAGGLMFNRRSTVSLMGGFGEVRLGRNNAATYTVVGDIDPFGDVGVGGSILASSASSSLSSVVRAVRVSNSLNYFTPSNLGGFYAHGQYYLGENSANTVVAGATTVGKNDGTGAALRGGYANGPLNATVSFGNTKYAALPANGSIAGDQSTFNAGLTYDLGMAKLWGAFAQDKVKPASGQVTGQGYLLGVTAPVGQGEFKASYASYAQKLNLASGDPTANKLAVGYVYNLSKRTALYSTLGFVRNKNNAGQVLNGAVLTGKNDNSSGIDFGLRHSF